MARITELGAKYLRVQDIDTSEAYLRGVDKDDPRYLIMLNSVRTEGIQQSILVRIKRDNGDTGNFLIDGLQRLTMAKDCGFEEILCKMIDCDDKKALSLQMQMNLPDPIRTEPAAFGRQLRRIIDLDPEMDEIELAKETNCTLGFIKQRLELTRLPEQIQNMVDNKDIIIGNAIEMVRFKTITPEYLEAAKKLSRNEFKEYVDYKLAANRTTRVKTVKKLFRPNPLYRPINELLNTLDDISLIKKIVNKHDTKETSFIQGVKYALSLDEKTVEERVKKHVEREKQEERDRDERKKKRLEQQLEELNKKENLNEFTSSS